MPEYKLSYFGVRGRAEDARYLFALADQKYEDHRISFEEWGQCKGKTPFGALPVLFHGDLTVCQTNAINGYLARQFGYHGKTNAEQARVDMVVMCMDDCVAPFISIVKEQDDTRKGELIAKFNEEYVGTLQKMEKLLECNGGGDGYFVGKSVTIADIHVTNVCRFVTSKMWASFVADVDYSKVPKLKALIERVEALPKIAAWIEKRPPSDR